MAIEPVVKHVFTKFTAIANSEEIKELETQRDVLFSILLRLIHNPKVRIGTWNEGDSIVLLINYYYIDLCFAELTIAYYCFE